MNPSTNGIRFSEKEAEAIRSHVSALFAASVKGLVDTDEKIRKAKEDGGSFDVIISTEALDRAGEIVRQSGWDTANYKNNAIVLWGHDYYALPIGVCLETYETTFRGFPALGARGVFLSAEINPMAQQVRKLYEFGLKTGTNVGTTTSVGFIPKEFDPNDQSVITKSELLEFSFVDVPANQAVGPAVGGVLIATVGSDYGGVSRRQEFDQIVINHGTIPLDSLYFGLKPLSSNHGEMSHDQLIAGAPQTIVRNPEGRFQLFRIGDAVAARNTHAAIYDALRLAKDI